MSKTLSMTAQYLRQIVAIDTNDAVEVNPEIVEGLEMASDDAKNELSSTFSPASPHVLGFGHNESFVLTYSLCSSP